MNDNQIECSEQMSVVCGRLEHEMVNLPGSAEVFNGKVHS